MQSDSLKRAFEEIDHYPLRVETAWIPEEEYAYFSEFSLTRERARWYSLR